MLPTALNRFAGTRITIVKGYKSAAELGLAMERGELQGSGSSSWEYVHSKGWIDKKLARMLFTIGLSRSQYVPELPTVVELATSDLGKNVMRLMTSASEIGRAILAPPGIPAERASALREAFAQMVKDPEFIAESKRRNLDVEAIPAADILKIVADDMKMSPDVVEATRAIMESEK
jgi:tripartite-type tricarboxylate transporter receptor subunit TctC